MLNRESDLLRFGDDRFDLDVVGGSPWLNSRHDLRGGRVLPGDGYFSAKRSTGGRRSNDASCATSTYALSNCRKMISWSRQCRPGDSYNTPL